MKRKFILFTVYWIISLSMNGQNHEWGIWTQIDLKKNIFDNTDVITKGEYRTKEGLSHTDRVCLGVSLQHKVGNNLKIDLGYNWIYSYHLSGKTIHNNYFSDYWLNRHRLNCSLTGFYNFSNFYFSLRERWQYTYRPQHTVDLTKSTSESSDNYYLIKGKGENILRSKIYMSYHIPNAVIKPYLYTEFFNGKTLVKTRYSMGFVFAITKDHALDVGYVYQNHNDDEIKGHFLHIKYSFTL